MINIVNSFICIAVAIVVQSTSAINPAFSLMESGQNLYIDAPAQTERPVNELLIVEDRAVNEARHYLLENRGKLLADLNEEEKTRSLLAIADASAVVSRYVFAAKPDIYMTDDGVAAIQVRLPNTGLLLLFSGDGLVGASIRNQNRRYSESITEYSLKNFREAPELSPFIIT